LSDLPVRHLADQHVVDPDGRVGDVALDAKRDRVVAQPCAHEPASRTNSAAASQQGTRGLAVHLHGLLRLEALRRGAQARLRARMVSPEICTSLNVIIVPAGAIGRRRSRRARRASAP
jgi:hypothetical protein